MALQDNSLEQAVKWSNAMMKQGYPLWKACQNASEWYGVDPRITQKHVLNITTWDGKNVSY